MVTLLNASLEFIVPPATSKVTVAPCSVKVPELVSVQDLAVMPKLEPETSSAPVVRVKLLVVIRAS